MEQTSTATTPTIKKAKKRFIKISNKGIIDPQAFTLLGASTKRDDKNKIGFFGSGLKYSIAYLLRNKIFFKVFADYKEIKFETKPSELKGISFDVIHIDGEKTSMTTEMGIDWEAWFAIREVYCNALDEGDASISICGESKIVPVEDCTVFYIEVTPDFDKLIQDWKFYFSENRKDLIHESAAGNKIYSGGQSLIVYRKGIRVLYYADCKSIFNYDITDVVINESRVIASEYDFKQSLRKKIQGVGEIKVITGIYNRINGSWEKDLYWNYDAHLFHDNWLEPIKDKTLVPYENAGHWSEEMKDSPTKFLILPNSLIEGLKSKFNDAVNVIGEVGDIKGVNELKVIETLSKKQQYLLDESVNWLKSNKYEIKYPMKVVQFFSKSQLGQAKDGNILLSERLFEMGRREVIATIIEEQEHLVTGFGDETRAFQSHFINKYISAMEDASNIYL